MGKAKAELALREGDGAVSSAQAAGRLTRNRFRALIDAAMEAGNKTGEPQRKLEQAYRDDPLGFMLAAQSLLPKEGEDAPKLALSFGNLYLQGVQAAQPKQVIDVTPSPGTSRVQDDASDW